MTVPPSSALWCSAARDGCDRCAPRKDTAALAQPRPPSSPRRPWSSAPLLSFAPPRPRLDMARPGCVAHPPAAASQASAEMSASRTPRWRRSRRGPKTLRRPRPRPSPTGVASDAVARSQRVSRTMRAAARGWVDGRRAAASGRRDRAKRSAAPEGSDRAQGAADPGPRASPAPRAALLGFASRHSWCRDGVHVPTVG